MQYPSILRASLIATLIAVSVVAIAAQGTFQGFNLQINGQVRYADTKQPAVNVLVRLENNIGGTPSQILTDQTGKFSFSNLRPAVYNVEVHAPGFIDQQNQVDLLTANSGYLTFMLVRDKSYDNRNLVPTSASVLDANSTPAAQKEFAAAKAIIDAGNTARMSEAIRHLEKAVSISPRYLAAQLALGLAYMDAKDWNKAEKPLLAATEISPSGSTAFFALGDVYRRAKKYEGAEKVLLQGLQITPDSAEAHTTLAAVYYEMAPMSPSEDLVRSRFENSRIEVAKALKLKPDLPEAHLVAGNLLFKARRPEGALVHYEKYLKLNPNGSSAAEVTSLVQKIKKALAESKNKSS